eukprot:CAMPEP_0118906146 /NCGR_PEP_ID=MMETSP1166-20130328/9890_1 /TAXON_ID=1104430 /ORGANISM="Chrysoreinhardia sp, Strain CCMP3193" /LENGTH=51 /DNA_ID=CAMNT_0006845429 /DNA_START=115 /DNA_END=270 /DNA_ORIENTATION=-
MTTLCPGAIRNYGVCIEHCLDNGTLERGACATEFDALKKCFREARRRQRGR